MFDFAGLRVLVVEDDGVVAVLLADELHDMGFGEVRTTHTLGHALIEVREWSPHIVLLDMHLTDGVSLPLAKVLADRGIPSVFMSGHLGAAKELGLEPESVLYKPFSPADLQAALQRALA